MYLFSGYLYLFKLLSSPHYQGNGRYLRKVMAIFEPTIQNLIDPVDIMSLLVSEGVIDRGDKETILTTRDQHGRTAAAVVMLERVQCRLEPRQWYIKLLQTLVRTDNLHVVRILEPDFLDDPDNFTRKLLEGLFNPELCSCIYLRSIFANARRPNKWLNQLHASSVFYTKGFSFLLHLFCFRNTSP